MKYIRSSNYILPCLLWRVYTWNIDFCKLYNFKYVLFFVLLFCFQEWNKDCWIVFVNADLNIFKSRWLKGERTFRWLKEERPFGPGQTDGKTFFWPKWRPLHDWGEANCLKGMLTLWLSLQESLFYEPKRWPWCWSHVNWEKMSKWYPTYNTFAIITNFHVSW